jgi:hypothetical protein
LTTFLQIVSCSDFGLVDVDPHRRFYAVVANKSLGFIRSIAKLFGRRDILIESEGFGDSIDFGLCKRERKLMICMKGDCLGGWNIC